jgi:hypothetical protein
VSVWRRHVDTEAELTMMQPPGVPDDRLGRGDQVGRQR